jgi:hypothetical protein
VLLFDAGGGVELNSDKLEVQQQWDADPCGASTLADFETGTLD